MRWAWVLCFLLVFGCADQQVTVRRYELTDLASGRVYDAEGHEINKVAGGVIFREEKTGDSINLSNYREREIEPLIYYRHWNGSAWVRVDQK